MDLIYIKIIKTLLSSIGCQEVDVVGNGSLAVQAMYDNDYDIILMDIMVYHILFNVLTIILDACYGRIRSNRKD
jgi:CheY-like chemotaxis protein